MQDYLKKLSLREVRLMMLGVGSIVTALVAMSLLIPNAKALRVANEEVRMLNAAAQDGAELDQRLEDRYAEIEELKYRLHGDMANLPARQVEAYIIGRLQRVSWNNNVELVSVEPAIGDRVQIFQEMLFHVQLVGQYGDLYRWLWEARKDLGFVVVKEYALRRQDQADEAPLLLADLSLASYRAVE